MTAQRNQFPDSDGTLRTKRANYALWTMQWLLALLFLFAGSMKLILPIAEMTRQMAFSGAFLRFIGVAEVLGAIGLILPWLLGIRRELTALAASGLVIIMVGATLVVLTSGSRAAALMPFCTGILLLVVARGRWTPVTGSASVTRGMARAQSITGTLLVLLVCAGIGRAADRPTAYPNMAPLEQYLIADRDAEIALARTAAPEAISRDAKVMVLTRQGYETAAEGKNGFVCVVERGWMAPFDNADFWNPKLRGPICFNPAAARSILPLTIKRTKLVLAGESKAQMIEDIKQAIERKELPALEPGAMSYMMSKTAYLTDEDGHNLCHLMIYAPQTDKASWGADLPGSPVAFGGQFQGAPEPITVFLIPVEKWSDGTPAPQM